MKTQTFTRASLAFAGLAGLGLAAMVCLLALPIRSLAQTPSPLPFSAIYSFGDCLTDTGNNTPSFTNWNNRWSNGPMWIETISTNLGLSFAPVRNYAQSGAATGTTESWDLGYQIANFAAPKNASNALFTVWAGPVDFYYHLGSDNFFGPFTSPTNDLVWNQAIAIGVRNLSNAVVRLYNKGARSVLVPNCDDVSRQPVVIRLHTEETRRGLQLRVEQFNAALAVAMNKLNQSRPDLRLICPDVFGLINRFIDQPAAFGMTKNYPAAMQDPALSDQRLDGPGADYVFWDEYGHPTTKGHTLIAAEFLDALQQAKPETLRLQTAGGGVTLRLEKLLIGRDYTLQTSSNLTAWSDVQSFTAAAGTNQWSAPVEDSDRGYYRLKWQP